MKTPRIVNPNSVASQSILNTVFSLVILVAALLITPQTFVSVITKLNYMFRLFKRN